MEVIRGLDSVKLKPAASVLTVGNFDGVHRGHQQLLAQGGLLAANTGHPLTVLTFEPHPLSVIAPDKAPACLTSLEDKLAQLAARGADITVVARSDPELLSLEAEAFARDILVGKFRPSHVVEGPSFAFGRGRRGTVDLLRQLGAEHGFEVCVVGPVELQVEPGQTVFVSSSLIRNLIARGKIHRAALCLGRPYQLVGQVVPGHDRGKSLGYPTANIRVGNVLIPPDGVYSGTAQVGDLVAPAAISIGTAPTFGQGPRQIEAHLLGFSGDLYAQTVRLDFLRWLRRQEIFPTTGALAEQLKRDIDTVRAHAHDADVAMNGDEATRGRRKKGKRGTVRAFDRDP